ncbi:hypothetical protein [Actinokineospora terrae]|uniref:Uncharacterized protein n=1 Tax=Actinokineospora terrae TaxID=155974 RepID=A0A1H9WR27_9PSEU|nr:hypothetical protein [Actinokineospora terrae]SES36274.1 hypothetical protein SAMN04487818_111103 [Actinokineospora terrae]
MIALTARDVPEIRARMTDWARDPTLDGAGNWFRFFLGPRPIWIDPHFAGPEDKPLLGGERVNVLRR